MKSLIDKTISYLPHLIFGVLFVFSFIFYKQRVAYICSSLQFFNLVNYDEMIYEAYRYSTFFTKFPIHLLKKTALSLDTLMRIFSVWFIVWYYIIFLIIRYIYNNKKVALALSLTLILCIEYSFYHIVTETHQGLVYSVLFLAWSNVSINTLSLLKKTTHYIIGIGIMLLCFFAHPVTIFTLLFIILLTALKSSKLISYQSIIPVIMICIAYLLKVYITPSETYEGKYFGNLTKIGENLPNFFNLYSYDYFFNKKFNKIYLYPLILIFLYITQTLYIKKPKQLFSLLGIVFFLVITIFVYYEGDSNIMMEKNYYPLGFFIAVLFVEPVFSNNVLIKYISFVFLIFISAWGINNIYQASAKQKERTEYLESLINKSYEYPEKKFICDKNKMQKEKILVKYALPFETLLLSASLGKEKSRTFYFTYDLESEKGHLSQTEYFLGPPYDKKIWINNLNDKYFDLSNSTTRILE
jgi:hypothetical protein